MENYKIHLFFVYGLEYRLYADNFAEEWFEAG
jgi:hypothetical protein